MIELDSASGIIQIPKVFDYQDLMDKLKNILQIDDELFKYLYFSYVDENEQERIRLNSQIYDDFINQEKPLLTIGFLENIDETIMDEFKDIIESNKKRFKEMNYVFPDEDISIQCNNINIEINQENEIEEEKIEEGIIKPKEENKIEEEKEKDIIEEIIIEKKEDKMEEESKEKEEQGESSNKLEDKKEEIQEEKKEEEVEEKIILIEKNNEDDENMEIENNNNHNLMNNKINSGSSEKFNLLELSKLNSKDINSINNIKLNKDSLELDKKESDNFHLINSSEVNIIELERNISDNIIQEENKQIEEDEFSKNIENIITSNIENIKDEIINSILIENSKIQLNSKINKKGPKNSYIHENYTCNNCQVSPIKGIRYHCLECNDYDLCEKCEEIINHNHPLYKIKKENACKFKNENYN